MPIVNAVVVLPDGVGEVLRWAYPLGGVRLQVSLLGDRLSLASGSCTGCSRRSRARLLVGVWLYFSAAAQAGCPPARLRIASGGAAAQRQAPPTMRARAQALSATRLAEVLRAHFSLPAPAPAAAAPAGGPAPARRGAAPPLALLPAAAVARGAPADAGLEEAARACGDADPDPAPAAGAGGVGRHCAAVHPGLVAGRAASRGGPRGRAVPEHARALVAGQAGARGMQPGRAGAAAPPPAEGSARPDAGVRPAGRARAPLRPLPPAEQLPGPAPGEARAAPAAKPGGPGAGRQGAKAALAEAEAARAPWRPHRRRDQGPGRAGAEGDGGAAQAGAARAQAGGEAAAPDAPQPARAGARAATAPQRTFCSLDKLSDGVCVDLKPGADPYPDPAWGMRMPMGSRAPMGDPDWADPVARPPPAVQPAAARSWEWAPRAERAGRPGRRSGPATFRSLSDLAAAPLDSLL